MIFVHALGTAHIDAGNTRITPSSARTFALLLRLAAEPGHRLSRAVLWELIYPDKAGAKARHSLRELVYRMRRVGVELETDTDGIMLPSEKMRFDFNEVVSHGAVDARMLKAIERGFLPGYAPTHSEAFAEWLDAYRARSMFELCRVVGDQMTRARDDVDVMMTEQAARACLALDPFHEDATVAMAEILAVGGSKAKALGLLDHYVAEVGPRARGVTLPVAALRRRIGEHLHTQSTSMDFPLVGRSREMALLNERLGIAKTGETQCVVLHGQPGIGKSRLAADCGSWAMLAGWRVERVAVQPHDRERPMGAFVDLTPNILKLPGALGAASESLAALKRLTKHELRDTTIALESTESSDAVSAAIVRAIGDVLDAVTNEAPLILVVEDVQWLDAESLRTLAGLVSPRRARRLLILLTSREGDSVRYFARHAERLTSIEVVALPDDLCMALVDQTLGNGASSADHAFRQWLVGASGGNPFFLHSLVRHYQTTGQEFSVSPTINALLDQRLATLSPPAMTVLWTSVALGNHSTIERLTLALEMPHVDLVTTVRELEVSRLIVQSGDLVTPAHWLLSDAVKRRATVIADKLGHRRIATILEAEARANNDANKLWDCAQHWLAADDSPRAIEMLTQCAQHSIEIGRLREAAELLLKAASSASNPQRHDLACKAIRLADQTAELDVVLRARAFVDRTSRANVHDEIELAELSAQGILSSERESAAGRLRECVLSSRADRNHRINAARNLLVIADQSGGAGLLRDDFEVLRRLIQSNDRAVDGDALKLLTLYHATVGEAKNLEGLANRLGELAQTSRPEIAANLYRYAGSGYWRAGKVSESLSSLRCAFELAESVGLRRAQFLAASMLSSFSHDVGRENDSGIWMDAVEKVADELPVVRSSLAYISICFERAVLSGDVLELKRLLHIVSEVGLVAGRDRIARAVDICIQRLSGDPVDRNAAAIELTRYHVRGGESGNLSDLEVAVAADLLGADGDEDAARNVVLNYLHKYRRGPAIVAAMLRDTIRRLDIKELPSWCRIYEIESNTDRATVTLRH